LCSATLLNRLLKTFTFYLRTSVFPPTTPKYGVTGSDSSNLLRLLKTLMNTPVFKGETRRRGHNNELLGRRLLMLLQRKVPDAAEFFACQRIYRSAMLSFLPAKSSDTSS